MSSQFGRKYAYNKAFKGDSKRLPVSLRSQYGKRLSHLNAALTDCVLELTIQKQLFMLHCEEFT